MTTLTTLTNSNRLDTINSVSVGLNPAGALDSFEQRTFEYNAAGRLSEVRENGTVVATYRYNQAGLRTHKTVGSVTTLYHYDLAGRLISETEPDGTVIREYIYALGVPVAQIDGGTPERIRYVHTDHLGSPWLATDDQAGIIWRWQGRAFGDHVPDVYPDGDGSLTEINLRFPGQYADAETGFYYNWFRYYDPATGRYLSSDPIGLAGGLNTYGYAAQNPITFTDPTGEAIPFIPILIKLGVGFAEGFAIDVAAQLLNNGLDFSCVDFGRAASVAAVDTLLGFGILKTVDRVRDAARVTKRTPNEAGVVREFVTEADQTFYRVFSGDNSVGGFVTAVKPRSSAYAQEALALPRGNRADMVQEVLVPAGTKVRRSRAAPIRANETFPNRRGGAEQFELLDRIPTGNFGAGSLLR